MATIGKFVLSIADYDDERSAVSVFAVAQTAANFDAQKTLKDNFVSAIGLMSKGSQLAWEYGNFERWSANPATDQDAQRELKWLVQYHDTTSNKRYSFTIPCANVARLDPSDRKHAAIGRPGPVDGVVTAIEAYVRSPENHAIKVDEITLVGRSV